MERRYDQRLRYDPGLSETDILLRLQCGYSTSMFGPFAALVMMKILRGIWRCRVLGGIGESSRIPL